MNTLQLYTWNVLSSCIYVNQMTWKSCHIEIKEMAKLDLQRSDYRQNIQIRIIQHWLKSKYVVICLQEVDEKLLEKLLRFSDDITVHYSRNSKFVEKQSRLVTLVKGYSSTTDEIDVHDRSILKTTILDCDIFNVHFYWKWNIKQVSDIGNIISDVSRVKFIICGDMNKQLDQLRDFIDKILCIHTFNENGFTSIFNQQKLYIDHIFVSLSLTSLRHPKVIKHIGNYKILYNISKLCQLYNDKKLSLDNWINKRKYYDISDHLPLMTRVQI